MALMDQINTKASTHTWFISLLHLPWTSPFKPNSLIFHLVRLSVVASQNMKLTSLDSPRKMLNSLEYSFRIDHDRITFTVHFLNYLLRLPNYCDLNNAKLLSQVHA